MLERPAWVRGRHDTGALCPSCDLAREAATLPLVTRGGYGRRLDPVGETASFPSPPGPRRLSPIHRHRVIHAMTPRQRSRCPAQPAGQAARSPRVTPPALTALHPNAAGIDVHADLHMVCVPAPGAGPPASSEDGG